MKIHISIYVSSLPANVLVANDKWCKQKYSAENKPKLNQQCLWFYLISRVYIFFLSFFFKYAALI